MRIISGRFRGRKLVHFKADHIRPTTDRVKESVFNRLQGDVDGSRVLDLFSGTGNLSCEAVSRGAASVDAVELSKKSIAIIRQNLELLEIENDVRVINEDVLKYLRRYEGEPYDLIFADPPFTEKLADQVLVEAAKSKAVGPNTLLIIESSSHEHVAEAYDNLSCEDRRDYGDKTVSFWRRP
ncbi:MAG: 16S rRNA (guanine(966)-N(2))-methyltransferase RsmD [Bdellovibrionota bacterium]